MTNDARSIDPALTARRTATPGSQRVAWLLLALNAASALAFMCMVPQPVLDDANHFADVERYATQPIDTASIRRHQNPTGPGSFLWMAVGGRLLGPGLLSYRFAVLLGWLMFGTWFLLRTRRPHDEGWRGAIIATLAFPHAPLAMATMLTEGPAIALATSGTLLWCQPGSRRYVGALGGLLVGLSVLCRQYYLALLASLALVVLLVPGRAGRVRAVTSAAAGALPVIWLLSAWHGFASPAMVAGTSYQGVTAKVALNLTRPLIALLYVALYLAPLSWPYTVSLRGKTRATACAVAALTGLAVTATGWSWMGNGPLRTLAAALEQRAGLGTALIALLATAAAYSMVGLGRALWLHRSDASRATWVSVCFIVLFVAEQAAVGGEIPFYERYVLQVMPFAGLVSWSLWPATSPARAGACALFWGMGQFMLWRYL